MLYWETGWEVNGNGPELVWLGVISIEPSGFDTRDIIINYDQLSKLKFASVFSTDIYTKLIKIWYDEIQRRAHISPPGHIGINKHSVKFIMI